MLPLGIDFGSRTIRLATSFMVGEPSPGQAQYLGAVPIHVLAGVHESHLGSTPLISQLDEGLGQIELRRKVPAVQVAAEVLQQIRISTAKKFEASVSHCAITVPCGFGARGRQQLQEAASTAGFESSRLLLEPIAILVAKKIPGPEKLTLVCSWGDSRCNILLARVRDSGIEELSSRGETSLSGFQLYQKILQQLRRIHRERTGRDPELTREIVQLQEQEARRAFQTLSTQTEVDILPFSKQLTGIGNYRLSRAELVSWIEDDLRACLEVCRQVLEKGGVAGPQALDEIWLAGGVTHIPAFREQVKAWWGHEAKVAEEESPALGAAIIAATTRPTANRVIGAPEPMRDIEPPQADQPGEVESAPPAITTDEQKVETSHPDQTPPQVGQPPEPFRALELKLIHALRQVDQMLEAGDSNAARDAMREIMSVIDPYRARLSYAQGIKLLNEVKELVKSKGEPDNPQRRKAIAQKVDGLLAQALDNAQTAVRLDHLQMNYQATLDDIRHLINHRLAEDKYEAVEIALRKNQTDEATTMMLEIVKLVPENMWYRQQCITLLERQLDRKVQEYNSKVGRLNLTGERYILLQIEKFLSLLVELKGPAASEVQELKNVRIRIKRLG